MIFLKQLTCWIEESATETFNSVLKYILPTSSVKKLCYCIKIIQSLLNLLLVRLLSSGMLFSVPKHEAFWAYNPFPFCTTFMYRDLWNMVMKLLILFKAFDFDDWSVGYNWFVTSVYLIVRKIKHLVLCKARCKYSYCSGVTNCNMEPN